MVVRVWLGATARLQVFSLSQIELVGVDGFGTLPGWED